MSKPTEDPPTRPPRRILRPLAERRDDRRPAGTFTLMVLGVLAVGLVMALTQNPILAVAPLFLLAVVAHVWEVTGWGRPSLNRGLRRLRLWLRGASVATCPLCRDLVVDGEDPLQDCGGCSVRYHVACHAELGGCATLGCPERPARRRIGSKLKAG